MLYMAQIELPFLETFNYTFFHTLVKNDTPLPLPTTS